MKSKAIICILFLSLFVLNTYSQKTAVKKADSKYDKYAYIDAIKTYEKVADKGYKSADMFQKLGNAYYFNAELEKAAKWYGELFALTEDVEPEYFYRYSQSLKSIGEYEKADQMLAKFNQKSGNDSRAKLYAKNKYYMEEIKANSGRHKVENAGINSIYSDYGSHVSGNKLIFASARDTGNFAKRKDKWTNQYFTKLYASDIEGDNSLKSPKNYSKKIKNKFNLSTPVITKDGKTIYFTGNDPKGEEIEGKNKERTLKIYRATLVKEEWDTPIELSINIDGYNVAHPALSPDEKILYFSSNMPGTIGQSDIYKATINEDGTLGPAENLGPEINTEGKETFPFVSQDNELYFSSDGHPGLGGLDIFATKITKDGKFKPIQNVGEPANSKKDDFGYYIDSKTRNGFLTSNRENGKGADDIYKFVETKKLVFDYILEGLITDKETKQLLDSTKVSLFDEKFKLIKEFQTAADAMYSFEVDAGKTYYVRAEKTDYNVKEQKITILKENQKTTLNFELEKAACKVTIGDNLGICFGIKTIYFDLDKYDIRSEAAIELEKILDVLEKFPKMKIDIRSHTDSRASHQYNQILSDRRAKATIEWLVKNGIEKNRLTGKGYGESQLVNKCTDDVECTEEQHQQNRRSEFIILA
ncbi:MAG: OmpA family protein, partial [Flavobacterium sp.]